MWSSVKYTRPTTIEAGDESSSTPSDLSGSDNNRGKSDSSNDSGGEDSDADSGDDDFGTTRMTEREVRRIFDDEVMSFIFNIHPASCTDSTCRCPRMQLLFSMRMTMTLK